MPYLLLFSSFIFSFAFSCSDFDDNSKPLIVGGRTASQQYNFFASISDDNDSNSTFCGGSFIESDVVLTAAHCVDGPTENLFVVKGMMNSNQIKNATKIPVKAIEVHESWESVDKGDDIAILFLDLPKDYAHGGEVRVDQTTNFPEEAGSARVIGFGNSTSWGSLFERELREVDVPIIEGATCIKTQEEIASHVDKIICAGSLEKGGVDSCQGDSGGPLFVQNPGEDPTLIGIVSWGIGCAQKNSPGFYTRVSAYSDWINKKISAYREPPKVLNAEDIQNIAKKYCYSYYDYNKNLSNDELSLNISDKLAMTTIRSITEEIRSVDPESPSETCSFTLEDGREIKARFLSQSSDENPLVSKFEVLIDTPNNKFFHSNLDKSTTVNSFCPDIDAFIMWDVTHGHVMISRADSFEMGMEVKQEVNESGRTNKVRCSYPDLFSFEGFTSGEKNFLEIKDLKKGTNHLFELMPEPDDIDAHIAVPYQAQSKVIVEIINNSEEDLLSWSLTCPVPFDLVDADQNKYLAKHEERPSDFDATTVTQYSYRFDHIENPKVGKIASKSGLSLQLDLKSATVREMESNPCKINSKTLPIR